VKISRSSCRKRGRVFRSRTKSCSNKCLAGPPRRKLNNHLKACITKAEHDLKLKCEEQGRLLFFAKKKQRYLCDGCINPAHVINKGNCEFPHKSVKKGIKKKVKKVKKVKKLKKVKKIKKKKKVKKVVKRKVKKVKKKKARAKVVRNVLSDASLNPCKPGMRLQNGKCEWHLLPQFESRKACYKAGLRFSLGRGGCYLLCKKKSSHFFDNKKQKCIAEKKALAKAAKGTLKKAVKGVELESFAGVSLTTRKACAKAGRPFSRKSGCKERCNRRYRKNGWTYNGALARCVPKDKLVERVKAKAAKVAPAGTSLSKRVIGTAVSGDLKKDEPNLAEVCRAKGRRWTKGRCSRRCIRKNMKYSLKQKVCVPKPVLTSLRGKKLRQRECRKAGRVFKARKCQKICIDLKKTKFYSKLARCLPKITVKRLNAKASAKAKTAAARAKARANADLSVKVTAPAASDFCEDGKYWSRSKKRCRRINRANCAKFKRVFDTTKKPAFCKVECLDKGRVIVDKRGRCKKVPRNVIKKINTAEDIFRNARNAAEKIVDEENATFSK